MEMSLDIGYNIYGADKLLSTEGQADLLTDARLMAITCALGIKRLDASKNHVNFQIEKHLNQC